MNTREFRSPLASRMEAFCQLRLGLGRKGFTDRRSLFYLDRFLQGELKDGDTITREVANRWFETIKHLSVGTRINHLSILRQFCRYLWHFDQRTYIVPRKLLPRRTRPAPYIYSRGEVRALLRALRQLGPPGSLRPQTLATLIGLLYAAGLRIGEALRLTLADVDLNAGVLVIRRTKFFKSRYVPVSRSTAAALGKFLQYRNAAGLSTEPSAPVFAGPSGRAYAPNSVSVPILEAARKLGIRGPKGARGPRIHDFRHTFAVHRLAAWYRGKVELHAKLPLLSTYLGHTTLLGTELYLHATAELLEQVNQRFRRHCAIPFPRRKEVSYVS